jgi:hypothetical protein
MPLYTIFLESSNWIADECILLDVMFMRITKEEAEKLPVETVPLDDGSGYLSGFDVFHQLHCLVSLSDLNNI